MVWREPGLPLELQSRGGLHVGAIWCGGGQERGPGVGSTIHLSDPLEQSQLLARLPPLLLPRGASPRVRRRGHQAREAWQAPHPPPPSRRSHGVGGRETLDIFSQALSSPTP